MLKLQAKSLKATVVLDPADLADVVVPNGQAKFPVSVSVGGRRLTADLNAKSLRRCVAAIQTAGPDCVAVVLQGKLEGDILAEAGIVAQPKVAKSEQASPPPLSAA